MKLSIEYSSHKDKNKKQEQAKHLNTVAVLPIKKIVKG